MIKVLRKSFKQVGKNKTAKNQIFNPMESLFRKDMGPQNTEN